MGSTAKGLRYPDPTQAVANVDQYIQNLASDVDGALPGAKMRAGAASVTTNASGQATINHGLGAVPIVVVASSTNSDNYAVLPATYTATQFSVTVRLVTTGAVVASTANITIRWFAVMP